MKSGRLPRKTSTEFQNNNLQQSFTFTLNSNFHNQRCSQGSGTSAMGRSKVSPVTTRFSSCSAFYIFFVGYKYLANRRLALLLDYHDHIKYYVKAHYDIVSQKVEDDQKKMLGVHGLPDYYF